MEIYHLTKERQQELLGNMNRDLRAVYTKVVGEAEQLSEANIIGCYRIGKYVADVMGDERRYGERAMDTLAEALGPHVSEAKLWDCRRLATNFSEAQLTKLLKQTLPSGGKISYSHLVLLAGLKPDDRKTMTHRVFKEDLSYDELTAIVQKKLGRRSSGGRKPKEPKTVAAGLRQIDKFTGEIHKRIELWDKSIFQRLSEVSPDEINDDLLGEITASEASVSSLLHDAELLSKKFAEIKSRASKILGKVEKRGPGRPKGSKNKAVKKTAGSAASRAATAKKKAAKKKKKATRKKKKAAAK